MKKKLLAVALATVMALSSAACYSSASEETGDKTLSLYIAGFQNLDPQIWSWGTHACRMGLFEGLTMMNTDFSTRLACAESLESNEDYTVWTATVKEGLVWSDGETLDANDFYYSFRRIMDPQYLAGSTPALANSDVANIIVNLAALQSGECEFEDVGIELVDDYTIVFTLSTPCDNFDYRLAESWALPVPEQAIEAYGDDWTTPENIVVNGAFTLASRDEDVHIQLVKNTLYWDAENVALEQVDVYAGSQDQFLAYQAGDINVATISTSDYEAVLASDYADQIEYYDTSIINFLGMLKSENNPLLEHPEIREAINLSIDREVLCNDVMLGLRTPATTLIYPGFCDWADDLDVISTTANIERAQELMAEAGYPNGEGLEPMTLLISGTADAFTLALANMITTGTGIEVNIVNLETAAFTSEIYTYYTDGTWGYYSTSWNCGVPFSSGAFASYQFDMRENLLPNEGLELVATAMQNSSIAEKEAAFATCVDEDALRYGELYEQVIAMGSTPEAEEIWAEMETMRLESYTFIPLCFSRAVKLVAPTIEGYNGNPTLLDAAPFNFKDISNG